jgi:hypothetical protein
MPQQTNPKIGLEKNFFVMSGLIKYRPSVLATKADKKPFATFLLLQTRQAGADYKEFTRYYQVMAFDQKVLDTIMSLFGEVKVEIKGNISIDVQTYERFGKPQRVSMSKLIATEIVILEETGNTFTLTKKEQASQGVPTYTPPPLGSKKEELTQQEKQTIRDNLDYAKIKEKALKTQLVNPEWTEQMEIARTILLLEKEALAKKNAGELTVEVPKANPFEIADEDLPF